ncbi:MAG: hypothetical protein M1503_10205 [Thaumarchaeota archaeon]|nr:hypothetical protein [Nitrososphaerota archaeon]
MGTMSISNSSPPLDIDYLLRDLFEDYQRLSKILRNTDPDNRSFVKLYDAKTKVGALIRDLLKLRGINVSEDDLVKILEKIPGKTAKKVRVILDE